MLTKRDIINHYKDPRVVSTIMRISEDEGNHRAGNWDFENWYKYANGKMLKLRLSNRTDYSNMIVKGRSLYWTLNLFNPDIFHVDYRGVKSGESPKISRSYTVGYTFGIDIDREHGKDIHDPVVKNSVEALAQYFTDKLRKYAPNSVYVLYSGGGIYIMVHHKVFEKFYSEYLNDKNPEYPWSTMLQALGDAFDLLIKDLKDEFFNLYPEHKGNVKPDQLNNSQRVFKTIYSVHKTLDYAVVPLDPANIKIDFERATLPLKSEVLAEGENWYTKYDEGTQFIDVLLKPHLEKALSKKNKTCAYESSFTCASTSIEDLSTWAPCMQNIYKLSTCGEGATRALAAFAAFLGQMNIEEEKAYAMFIELVDRWGARASNIFESYYKIMKVPTCASLNSDSNIGFPKGCSVKNLGVCRPNAKCLSITSPRYYADKEANKQRLLFHLAQNKSSGTDKVQVKESKIKNTATPSDCSKPKEISKQLEAVSAVTGSKETVRISTEGWTLKEGFDYAFSDIVPERLKIKGLVTVNEAYNALDKEGF
ncbi:MAG: hypothetical protein ABFD07_00290 [Methanobacterium sp.]